MPQQGPPGTKTTVPPLPAAVLRRVFWRSLALQGAWNRQRMQNLGLLVALLPYLRHTGGSDTQSRHFCSRHFEYFNTNPYLANVLIGGVLRLESDQGQEHGLERRRWIRMFKKVLGRSLASLGDQFFWLGMRPALMLLACLAGFFGQALPAVGLVAVFGLLQLEFRRRGLAVGYRAGADVVELLDNPLWHKAIRVSKAVAMLMTGAVAGVGAARFLTSGPNNFSLPGVGILAVGLGIPLLGRRSVRPEGMFLLAVLFALALGCV